MLRRSLVEPTSTVKKRVAGDAAFCSFASAIPAELEIGVNEAVGKVMKPSCCGGPFWMTRNLSPTKSDGGVKPFAEPAPRDVGFRNWKGVCARLSPANRNSVANAEKSTGTRRLEECRREKVMTNPMRWTRVGSQEQPRHEVCRGVV